MPDGDPLDRLRRAWERLPADARETLLAFAEFLLARHGRDESPQPRDIPRPPEESVVQAMQRLTRTYPMLAPDRLLQEASGFMSQHVREGRPAAEVIDELERLFRRHYQAWTGGADDAGEEGEGY